MTLPPVTATPAAETAAVPLLALRGITKTFFGAPVNIGIDLTLRRGETLALLGENGAGKSTLMKVLYGLYRPDAGTISINGKSAAIRNPHDAIRHGIGMVHQHFTLVNALTVTENIILGLTQESPFCNLKQAGREIAAVAKRYRMDVDPEQVVGELSVGQRQRVEILKALYRNAEILILDEPTAVLTPQEAAELFASVKKLQAGGKGIIFISHKMDEIKAMADRVLVLRGGTVTLDAAVADVSVDELTTAMVGRCLAGRPVTAAPSFGPPVLTVKRLSADNNLGIAVLKGISFTIKAGEVFGIAGVSGNGQKELAEVLSGIRRPASGRILYKEQPLLNDTPRQLTRAGFGRIPEDRMESGSILDLPLSANLTLENYHQPPYAHGPFLQKQAVNTHARKLVNEYDIKTHTIDVPARTLSGGNLQKAILARVLHAQPELIIAAQPVRGLDIGATEYIHQRLREQQQRGAAILLISEDLDELFAMADTIGVMCAGELVRVLPRREADIQEIGRLMAGVREGSSR